MKEDLIDNFKAQSLRGERTINDTTKHNRDKKTGVSPYEGMRTCL